MIDNPTATSTSHHSLWDAFEHILLFISLYVLTISVSLTLHFFIDKWSPNVMIQATNVTGALNTINLILLRVYMAAMIVSYPIFSFLFLHITKRTKEFPEIRQLKSRKILIYLTLVISFMILISNIVSIVYYFLSGNVSVNFILHFFTTIFINGLIFAYYLYQIREDKRVYV